MSLTELHLKLIELDRKKAEVKKFYEEYKSAVEALVAAHGIGHHFIDDQQIVYQLAELDGKWVTFERYGIERTKRPTEDKGTLSVKKAKELGYDIK
jgi:hypothetical protein